MNLVKSKIAHILILTVLTLLIVTSPALAEIETGKVGVSLLPYRGRVTRSFFKYELEPGERISDGFLIFNNSKKEISVRVYRADATNTDDGSLTGGGPQDKVEGVGTWIKMENQHLKIPPEAQKLVKFEFKVPEGTPPGDHFSFIFVEPIIEQQAKKGEEISSADKAKFRVKVVQRLGIVVWERVPGEYNREIVFSDLKKQFKKGKLYLEFTLANKGNVFIKPILGWKLVNKENEEVMFERKPKLYGYLLPGKNNVVNIPVTTRRPLPRGDYRLGVTLGDEKSDYRDEKVFEITLP